MKQRRMELLGIEFVPLNVSIKDRLEALSAGIVMFFLLGLIPIGIIVTIYISFFTKYWPLLCVYLFWIWVIDRETPEKGGRPNDWVQSWTLFKYVQNYFPINVKAVPGFKIDPKINYLACSFPHGVMPVGLLIAFQTNALKQVKKLFPCHISRGSTLNCNFYVPIYREFLLAIGMCSTTPQSLNWMLSHPEGGRITGLLVGGAAESFYSQAGQYRLKLKDRKGFIKLALKNGAGIIPIFAFGQNDSFRHRVFPEGSMKRTIQEWIKRITGVALIAVYGRGLFQYSFGLIPLQKPVNIVVGHPLEVQKIEQPTQKDIDDLHQKFIERLSELFEEYKYEYEEDPDKSQLIIV